MPYKIVRMKCEKCGKRFQALSQKQGDWLLKSHQFGKKCSEKEIESPLKYACQKCGKRLKITVAPHLRSRLDLCECED